MIAYPRMHKFGWFANFQLPDFVQTSLLSSLAPTRDGKYENDIDNK